VFFCCWVGYSFAISTVFQAYLTAYLVEPGYEQPIKSVEEMLNSERKFGFYDEYGIFFNKEYPIDSTILNKAARFPDRGVCFNWAAVYQNMSIIFDNLSLEIFRYLGRMKDENNRPLLCELQDGGVLNVGVVLLVLKGSPLLEFINDIIQHTVESGILIRIKERNLPKEIHVSIWDDFGVDNAYMVFGVSHLQTAFYLLTLGYVLSFACFVTEIMWHRYKSKSCGPTVHICVTDKQT
jgi:hypothetical protein